MAHEKIRSVRQLIDTLGGAGKVAEWLGVSHSAVLNWVAADAIPPGRHLPIYLACRELGLAVDQLVVFGLPPSMPRAPVLVPRAI